MSHVLALLVLLLTAIYARQYGDTTSKLQGANGDGSTTSGQADQQELAQSAAMQESVQLMFGGSGGFMPFTLDMEVAQTAEEQLTDKPAIIQRMSMLARAPADAPSLRPFNMLGALDIVQMPAPQIIGQSGGDADLYSSGSFQPQMELTDTMQADTEQARLSMTGMVTDPMSAHESWMNSGSETTPSAAVSPSKKSRKHRKKSQLAGVHGPPHTAAAGSALQDWDGEQGSMQPEFSFSPLGDSSSRIQQETAFSPLAVGAGQFKARPTIGQRIRKSLFGPTRDTTPGIEAGAAKVHHRPVVADVIFAGLVSAWHCLHELLCHAYHVCCCRVLRDCCPVSTCCTALTKVMQPCLHSVGLSCFPLLSRESSQKVWDRFPQNQSAASWQVCLGLICVLA